MRKRSATSCNVDTPVGPYSTAGPVHARKGKEAAVSSIAAWHTRTDEHGGRTQSAGWAIATCSTRHAVAADSAVQHCAALCSMWGIALVVDDITKGQKWARCAAFRQSATHAI